MALSRRSLLTFLAGLPLPRNVAPPLGLPADALAQMRAQVQNVLAGRDMALELRALDGERDELFRIQVNAERLMPVASCFKAFAVPWYYLTVPPREQEDGPGSDLWNMVVHSGNHHTGVIIEHVARLVPGAGNAIEKFNDFLASLGMQNGLFTWQVGPTAGLYDLRYRPSAEGGRVVQFGERIYWTFNVFTASDLAQGYDFIARGEQSRPGAGVAQALRRTRRLLARPEPAYPSPLERVFAPGYIGKQGSMLLPGSPAGLVFNDAGLLRFGRRRYIVAFLSVVAEEQQALAALREVVQQVGLLEQALERQGAPLARIPRVQG